MDTIKRSMAAAEVVLLSPAVLFMTALFVRNLQPRQYEPARSAQRIVMLYASSVHVGLWVLLIALPLAVFLTGCVVLRRSWSADAALREAAKRTASVLLAYLPAVIVALTTVTAGVILACIGLHVLTD